jgi:hypothetical protein
MKSIQSTEGEMNKEEIDRELSIDPEYQAWIAQLDQLCYNRNNKRSVKRTGLKKTLRRLSAKELYPARKRAIKFNSVNRNKGTTS